MKATVLAAHGTRAFVLPPSAIVAAAERDLKLRLLQRGEAVEAGVPVKPYCFVAAHVRRASGALDLIDRAIAGRYDGVYSGKRVTRLVYQDEAMLHAARALASPIGALDVEGDAAGDGAAV